jgi:putative ABC transport system permease protein
MHRLLGVFNHLPHPGDIWRDLRHAARSLAHARAFTVVCVVSLGIGMTPVIAIPYASRVLNKAVTPPGVKTDGLVEVLTKRVGPRPAASAWSYPDFTDLRAADTGLVLVGWANGEMTQTMQTSAGVETRSVFTKFVSANYFRTFGVALVRKPGFDPAMDDPPKTDPVVVLGYDFWQQELAADPVVVGKRLTLDGVPHVVVGIAPRLAVDERQLFIPLEQDPRLSDTSAGTNRSARADRSDEWVHVNGRLLPGVSIAQASAAVSALTSRLAAQYPATNELKAGIVEAYDPVGVLQRPQFRILQTVALTLTGIVLLVVCLNISGMMQVRYAMRERELAIRRAIGASRGRLVQHLLAEAVILAGLGGTLASIVLFNLPSVVMWLSDEPLPAQIQDALRVDTTMIAICAGFCLVTSLACGLLPAMRFSRPALLSSLKDDTGVGGRRAGRVHRPAAALQVAIAVPLIVMAGISLDRVRATATADLGFDAERLYAAPLKLDGLTVEQASFQIRKLRDLLATADGVASVTVADGLPLDFRSRMTRVSLPVAADVASRPIAVQVTRVGDDYLGTMGIRLVRGRGFTADDRAGAEPATIISKPLADRLAPDGDVIGRRLVFGTEEKSPQVLTVVGVTGDFPTSQMSNPREQLLVPLAQHPGVQFDAVPVATDEGAAAQVMLIARGAVGAQPARVTGAVERIVRELDPAFQPADVVTGAWLRRKSMNDFLTQSAVAGGAGGVILILSALGIYGVVGLMVATRTREMAVRLALGASRGRVIRTVVFDVVKLVVPGIGVGLILTVALMRLNSENMGIPLSDVEPLAYVVGAAVALLVAILASLVPARRAASVQPMIAMRSE